MLHLEKFTLPELALSSAERFKKRTAFNIYSDGDFTNQYTYREFGGQVRRFASVLIQLGVQPGERVMILSENRPEWAIAYFGISLAGAVMVPVLTECSPEQIRNIAEHAGVSLICSTEKMMPKLKEAEPNPELPLLRIDTLTGRDVGLSIKGMEKRMKLLEYLEFPPVEEDGLASIIYTSGTMGNSKAVMLSHRNIISDALSTRSFMKIYPRDRFLSIIPLAHSYECTMGLVIAVLNGAATTYLARHVSSALLLPAIQAVRPTAMLGVPLIIENIYRHNIAPKLEKHPFYGFAPARYILTKLAGSKLIAIFGGALRFFGLGGAGLAPDTEEFLKAAKFPYSIGYGLTEAAPSLTGSRLYRTVTGSSGSALGGIGLRIVNGQGQVIGGEGAPEASPEMAEGEIQARGPNIMLGYYKDDEATREAFTEDGWLKTGDLGCLDKGGFLFIKGRIKTLILGPSGENIYPEEIEHILNSQEIVADSLVYPGERGEVIARIILSEKAKTMFAAAEDALSELRRTANRKLASFSRIHRIEIQDEPFEKTPTNKTKRFVYPRRAAETGGLSPESTES